MDAATASKDSPASKGNDYAIDALKQLLTLSSVVLALTITFLKDALGDARAQAVWPSLVPLTWGLLLLVIWLAWVAVADAARAVGTTRVLTYEFARGRRRFMARAAQFCFAAGLTCLALFASLNLHLFFPPVKPNVVEEVRAKRIVIVDDAGKVIWKAP